MVEKAREIAVLDTPVTDPSKWVETWFVSGRLTRLPVEPDQAPRPELEGENGQSRQLLSKDGKFRYSVLVGAEVWDLADKVKELARPKVMRTLPGDFSAFKVGRPITLSVEEHPDGFRFRSAAVEELFEAIWPYYVTRPKTGQTPGLTPEKIEAHRQQVQAAYQKLEPELQALMPVKLKVTPELAMAGEKVSANLEVVAEQEPNGTLLLYPSYLIKGMGEPKRLQLEWRQETHVQGRKVFRAELELPAEELGQHLIRWDSKVGDIETYWRSYAVIDKSYAVVILNVLSSPHEPFQENHLPYDFWASKLNKAPFKTAKEWAKLSEVYRRYGAGPQFMIDYVGWNKNQIREESEANQRATLKNLKSFLPLFGFDPDNLNFGDYGVGSNTTRIARELGYSHIHSLLTENYVDGAYGINHWGKPERPYFLSEEDFRKVGDSGQKAMLGFSQIQRHLSLARSYYSQYVPEAYSYGWYYTQKNVLRHKDPEAFYRKMIDFVDAMLQSRLSQKVPYFVTFNFQLLGVKGSPDPEKHIAAVCAGDRMIVETLLKKAKTEPVAFATSWATAEFYRRHFPRQPEVTSYYHDFYAGITSFNKPALFPDVMTLENDRCSSIHWGEQILPESHYDYSLTWNYPDFGNDQLAKMRSEFGYMEVGRQDKFSITPKITDTRKTKATRREELRPDGSLSVILEVESDKARKAFPLALWNLPRQWRAGEDWYRVAESSGRFVPVRAPYTGNLNGFLVADLKAGANRFTLVVNSEAEEPRSLLAKVPEPLVAQAIERDGRTTIYLWSKIPWGTKVELNPPSGKSVVVYPFPIQERVDVSAKKELTIEPQSFLQIEGLSKEEFEKAIGVASPEALARQQ